MSAKPTNNNMNKNIMEKGSLINEVMQIWNFADPHHSWSH